MKVWGSSDCGKLRDKNEDAFIITEESPALLAVADGMGGHKAGEVASSIAISLLKDYDFNFKNDIVEQIRNLIITINQKIIDKGRTNPEYLGMGTTLTLGVKVAGKICYGHVGDSRFYLYRKEELNCITEDHSLVGKMLAEGKISKEEAFQHPRSNVLTQALGLEKDLTVDSDCFSLERGDLLLFCTDGLTDMLPEEKISQLIAEKYPEPKEITETLKKKALEAGGRDNITIVTGFVQESGK